MQKEYLSFLYLIITERAEYQKIACYINKNCGRWLNNR